MSPDAMLRRWPAAVIAALIALAITSGASANGAAADPGTIETLAGPSFCAGGTTRDRSAESVRALAVDVAGRVFVDTGRPADAYVARLGTDGSVTRVVTGVPAGVDPPDPDYIRSTGRPAAGRLAADQHGGVLIAAGGKVVDIDANGGLTTVTGDPAAGPGDTGGASAGDGGPALGARLHSARSLATDRAGNLYIADAVDDDRATFRIRLVNRGVEPLTIFPGTPHPVVIAPAGIDTIAGASGGSPYGDGGPAIGADLRGVPPTLAVAGSRLYIAEYERPAPGRSGGTRVRLVNLGGAPITLHGRTVPPGAIDTILGGHASPSLGYVPGIDADPTGTLYLADETHDRVLEDDAGGHVSTLAGVDSPGTGGGFNGNDRPAATALLDHPYDVRVGPDGRILIADQLNGQVRSVDTGHTIRALPGGGLGTTSECASTAELPQPGGPVSVAPDPSGVAYVALANLNEVVRVDADGHATPIVGNPHDIGCSGGEGCAGFSGDGGPAARARLHSPTALALRPGGGLYVFDAGNHRVRFVNLDTHPVDVHGMAVAPGSIATVAGNGDDGGNGDGGPATRASLSDSGGLLAEYPDAFGAAGALGAALPPLGRVSLAAGGVGDLVITDAPHHRLRRVDGSGRITSLPSPGVAGDATCCHDPVALAVDPAGILLVADLDRDARSVARPRIWAINDGNRAATVLGQLLPPGNVRPVAGTGTLGFTGDGGSALAAQLLEPTGLELDRRGNLYIAEVGPLTSDIRRVDANGVITTVAGDGPYGFNGDARRGQLTRLSFPSAVAVDVCGNLLIADAGNDRVRRLVMNDGCTLRLLWPASPAGSSPAGPLLPLGGGAALVAAIVGSAWWVRRRGVRP